MILNAKFLPNGYMFMKRFVIIGHINDGAHGSVYKCRDATDMSEKALKALNNTRETSQGFRAEIEALRKLEKVDGIPRMYGDVSDPTLSVFVTDLFASDLSALKENAANQHLDTSNVLCIAWHLIPILEKVHELKLIHADIKANNIALKFNPDKQEFPVVLFDFGNSDSIEDDDDEESRGGANYNILYYTPSMVDSGCCNVQDDLLMATYTFLDLLGGDCFGVKAKTGSTIAITEKKVMYESSPMSIQSHTWIGDLVTEIKSKEKNGVQNYARMKSTIKRAKRGFQPETHKLVLKTYESGKMYLE